MLAERNGVADRIAIRGACGADDLCSLRGQRALIISDCEGFERRLFTAATVPALLNCDLLIETHDFIVEDTAAALLKQFDATHAGRLIPIAARRAREYPAVGAVPASLHGLALDEGRPANQLWLWLQSRNVKDAGLP